MNEAFARRFMNGASPVGRRVRYTIADQCRDARGTGFVDDVARDILYALRTFRRAPLAALTIVATVALGLGLIATAFTLYSAFFLRSDAVQNASELVAVERSTRGADALSFTRAEYESMRALTIDPTTALRDV